MADQNGPPPSDASPGSMPPGGMPPPPMRVSDIFPSPRDTPDNLSSQVLAVHIFLPTFSLLFVVARLYVRSWILKTLGWDDLLLVVGYIAALAADVLICVQTQYGLGWPVKDIEMWQMFQFQKLMYPIPPLFLFAGLLVKASLIVLYYRIAVERWSHYACHALHVLNVLFWISFSCGAFFGCNPIPFFWDKTVALTNPGAKCIDYPLMYRIQGALNIVIDFFILLVPIVIVMRSAAMSTRKKRLLYGLFALGSVAWIAALLRIPTFTADAEANIFKDAVVTDRWSQLEIHVAIITASAPILRRLFFDASPEPSLAASRAIASKIASQTGNRKTLRETSVQLDEFHGTDKGGSDVTLVIERN